MNNYKIIDNILDEDDVIRIEKNVLQEPIFGAYESTASESSSNIYDVMMSKVFFSSYYSPQQESGQDDKYLPHFYPLLDKVISDGFLLRVSLNLTFATPNPYISEFHVDTNARNSRTCVYYLNSNNGGTKFKNSGEFVQSQRNRCVMFPSHLYHAAVNTTDTKLRWVLNINYVPN